MPQPPRSPTSSRPAGGDGGLGGLSAGAIIATKPTPHLSRAAAYSSSRNARMRRRCASSSARSRAASAFSRPSSKSCTLRVNAFVTASNASTRRSAVLSALANSHPTHEATPARAAPISSAGSGGKEISCMGQVSHPGKCDSSHARGAYIIGQMRFPPPFATTFVTTVLFGHTSTVDPSDVPSVFSSG